MRFVCAKYWRCLIALYQRILSMIEQLCLRIVKRSIAVSVATPSPSILHCTLITNAIQHDTNAVTPLFLVLIFCEECSISRMWWCYLSLHRYTDLAEKLQNAQKEDKAISVAIDRCVRGERGEWGTCYIVKGKKHPHMDRILDCRAFSDFEIRGNDRGGGIRSREYPPVVDWTFPWRPYSRQTHYLRRWLWCHCEA